MEMEIVAKQLSSDCPLPWNIAHKSNWSPYTLRVFWCLFIFGYLAIHLGDSSSKRAVVPTWYIVSMTLFPSGLLLFPNSQKLHIFYQSVWNYTFQPALPCSQFLCTICIRWSVNGPWTSCGSVVWNWNHCINKFFSFSIVCYIPWSRNTFDAP